MNTYNTLACPACQNPVAADSQFCPHCGTQFAIPSAVDSPPVYGQQPWQPAVQQPIPGYPQQVAQSYPQQQVSGYPQQSYVPQTQGKSRTTYILLGAYLGWLGIHNFYAGYTGKAIGQLVISVLTLGGLALIPGIWALVDVCTVKIDAKGQPMFIN